MGTDLHAPLGQNRPSRRRRTTVFFPALLLALAGIVGIMGLSLYAMRGDETLRQVSEDASPPTVEPAGNAAEKTVANSSDLASNGLPRSGPHSGASVERTLTDDGTVVTKYTPRQRQGEGRVLIDTPRVGQDPRMAALPNEALLEETPQGRLPVISSDGLRPMDQYARPWSGARGTRVAIVLGGLGLSQTGSQKAIKELPGGVTLAFAATGNSLQRWMQEARRSGHEILIQVPLEPFGYPNNDPGPSTLLADASAKENLARLHEAMGRITNYTGIMNYLGGRYLADADALEPVLRDIASRGLLFLDDGSSTPSVSGNIAKAIELPHAFADVTLDSQLQVEAVLRKLDDLERIARRNGTAIGVASAFDESIEAIGRWAGEAERRGIEIVGISALVTDPAKAQGN
ncbi:divergent polysaccharide deacetylase family protein [Rhizobium sp. LCM 4573]|uniref:divergent polysaccharide deacetylase family protein n=1 Tax=Rhizobium sp. LCM 4573 TaxID=1848291 RepID=UPI0008D976B2|nr:divergent polysaccharide deacetylase family protein [Rhizobium sp. LCM 4573]OHV80720.1 hypothetical protein LCM4573_23020 [Rhizobium sp. LCM 4573]